MRVSRGAGHRWLYVGLRHPTRLTASRDAAVRAGAGVDVGVPLTTTMNICLSHRALFFHALSAEAVGMCPKAALEDPPMSGHSATRVCVFTNRAVRPRLPGAHTHDPSALPHCCPRYYSWPGPESKEQQREAMKEMRDSRCAARDAGGADAGGAAGRRGGGWRRLGHRPDATSRGAPSRARCGCCGRPPRGTAISAAT